MYKNIYLIVVLVILLALGAGAVSPDTRAAAQSSQNQTSECDHAATFLVGRSGELPRIKGLIHDICEFRVRMSRINTKVSEFDRDFIEDAITGNTLEIQSIEIALAHADNEEWRGILQMMLAMHTSDLEMAIRVAEKIGVDTEPDLTRASVYPETPDYDLGMREVNLVARFLEPLMNAAGTTGTPTAIPTGTGMPTMLPTGTGTAISTFTGTAVTGTVVATGTGTTTPVVTGTTTPLVTGTSTFVPTPTGTSTAMATTTSTTVPIPTGTGTNVPTMVATGGVTSVPTIVPPGTGVDFNIVSLHIIEEEHVMDIQSELVAQRLVKNDELRAFAKHAADVTELHLLLMSDLKHRLMDNYTPPEPKFQEDYQGPRRFEPAGQ